MEPITNTAWFFKYKPKSIDEYVFENEDQKQQVINWIQNGKIDGNLLLYGPAGTGKTALAELLINSILKSKLDLNKIKSRSVSAIDELEPWLQKRPVKSKTKIVYFEEFDRISDKAFDQLKDGLLEKYQSHVSFIAATNYIRRIPHPIQTRFTIKFELNCTNVEGVFNRLKTILDTEKIEYSEQSLYDYVQNNIRLGMRDLINNLQTAVCENKIDFTKISIQKSTEEDELVVHTLNILKTILQLQDINLKKLILINPLQSDIRQDYARILEIVNLNNELQYEIVLEQINEQINYIPLKLIIDKYMEQFPYKKFPHITYLAFLAECIKCVIDIGL